tara:strand:- start:1137 stop:2528 length:1392 start_codon:yes stop_codon:yes gene_type:complete
MSKKIQSMMFKKIEAWILYITILLSIFFAVGFGVLVRQELAGNIKAGWISKTALSLAQTPAVFFKPFLVQEFKIKDRFPSLDGFEGNPNLEESYLLLSRYDGDLQEGVVDLIDLTNFEVLHTWNPDIDAFNDLVEKVGEFKYLNRDKNNSRHLLYHPILTKKGDLFFHAQSTPLRSIDRCSKLVFQNIHDVFHHSIETDIEGNIWSSTRMHPQKLPANQVGRDHRFDGGYSDDAIVKVSQDGEVLYEKSVSQIFIDNGMESRLSMIGSTHNFQSDPIHINDIQPVNFDSAYWKKGDVFISLGHQSMVILFRPSTEEIIWKYEKNLFHQHDINIINEKEISIFNNNRRYFYPNKDVVDGHNEVLIYNFEAEQMSSYFQKSLETEDVRTLAQGRGKILSNGDLFIEETDFSRILYYNSDASLRWTHLNRANNGNIYMVGWSRILYTQSDIQTVNNFLDNKVTCNE